MEKKFISDCCAFSKALVAVLLMGILSNMLPVLAQEPCANPSSCESPDNGSGTAVLPPQCTGGLKGKMQIVDGLPLTSPIEIDAKLFGGAPISRGPGGLLGGDQIIATEMLAMDLKGTGPLSGLNRSVNVPVQEMIFTGPYTPGTLTQSFPTEMVQLQGQLPSGDPDFDLLRITGGSGFGMPSPGHTTLTHQPGGQWAVESFFDITYRIDFVGAPGGQLAGMSGSTIGTARFKTGTIPVPCNDDGDPCTDDICIEGVCQHIPKDCSDGDLCTADECIGGNCVYTLTVICDDGNPCTMDACENGICDFTPSYLSAAVTGTPPTSCGECDGSATVTVTGGTPPYSYLWSTGETAQSIGEGTVNGTEICIDAGDTTASYITAAGDTFVKDKFFSGGTIFNKVVPIAGTNDDEMYQNERFVGNGGFFSYNIPVINGNYAVELHFAEIFFGLPGSGSSGGAGSRKFDVTIEGALALDDYDIFFEAGGPAIAIVETINVSVNDGVLNILFDGIINNAKINGLCVRPVLSPGLCPSTYSVTVTDAKGCTATDEILFSGITCDDGNHCTADTCINGACQHTPISCFDNDACTDDFCNPAVGCHYLPVECGDNNRCTDDFCDSNIGCHYLPFDCSDNDGCTNDHCDAELGCYYSLVDCNDNNECTEDFCSAEIGCHYVGVNCDDSEFCTDDFCNPAIGCHYLPHDCTDNDVCTEDRCENGGCAHAVIPGCDDPCFGVNCNDNDACTDDSCIEGDCDNKQIDCNDDDPCTDDSCDDGLCVHAPKNCSDNNACTTDGCNNGVCTHVAMVCNDNDACTDDACVNGSCVFTGKNCNDNNACTNDACAGGNCVNTLIDCNDNNPCTTDACVSFRCANVPINCSDNNPCTTDACNNGLCVNTAIVCSDNDTCTQDACVNGICVYTDICQPCTLEVVSFTLVNSSTDLDIGPLNDGDVVNLFYTPNVNVRANLCVEPIGSVKFNLNGPTAKVENTAPYAIAGDSPAGNYNKWNISTGTHTIEAIPFSGSGASGTMGTGKLITIHVINEEITCSTNAECDDSNLCTDDACVTGQCFNTPLDCNDNDACTHDGCLGGICQNTGVVCDDGNLCTIDDCNGISGCSFAAIPGCCLTAEECDDSDHCTADDCVANFCVNTPGGGSEPSYLHVVNTSKSWRKLKLGYSSTSLFSPKNDVKAGGNTMMCVTLRGTASTEWSKIQIRPQGSVSSPVSLGAYGLGESFMEICIPLTAFGSVDFTKLTLIEIPYSKGAAAFEIDIQKIEFRGGATPFLWFGDPKTDNIHDGQSGGTSSLYAELVEGGPCGAEKMTHEESASFNNKMHMNAYPNPFSDKLNIEFTLTEGSKAALEIYNAAGQKLATLFDGYAGASELVKVEYNAGEVAGGMVIYRLQTEQGAWFSKAMLVK